MSRWTLPFHRWPLYYHAVLAALVVVSVAGAVQWVRYQSRAALQERRAASQTLQGQLDRAGRNSGAATPAMDFSHTLPEAKRVQDVVQSIASAAQTLGVQVVSLSVEQRAATATELGKTQFSLVANADYRAAKALLAELLGRYPAIGVQSLSMSGLPNDPSRLDVRASLVLVTKD